MERRSGHSPAVLAVAILAVALALPPAGAASADPAASLLAGCSPNDITTGGGWIAPGGRVKRTFGLQAGIDPNAPVPGRLVFLNRPEAERLNGMIISYAPSPTSSRVMMGTGEVNDEAVVFLLRVTDNNGSATPDFFSLSYTTSDGPRDVSGPLGGGNIQIHPTCV